MKNIIIDQFGFAGGSVIGSDHAMYGRPGAKNNQDAYFWAHGRNCSFAVVCDGCSSGAHSEVGAKLISRILAKIVVELADKSLDVSPEAFGVDNINFWSRVQQTLVNDMLMITRMIGGSQSQTVTDFFLCTIVGALITPHATQVVSVGDGAFAINGEITHLKPGEGNSPTYLAYQITGTTLTLDDPSRINLLPQSVFRTENLESLLLMTDGVDDLIKNADSNLPGKAEQIGSPDQFTHEKFIRNPDNVRRRLNLIGSDLVKDGHIVSSPLKDDTTVVTIIRKNNPTTSSQTP